jgi:RNA polymerase sigma-70 factor (ECF subfamily)
MECPSNVLVQRALRRDGEAFVELLQKHDRRARAIAFRVLHDATAAGDVVQDAFGRAWERLSYVREPSQFGTWLCGIVHNLAIDELRRWRMKHVLAAAHAARCDRSVSSPFDEAARREERMKVGKAVAELDELSRALVMLRYYEDHVTRQIATEMNLSPAAVNMRLFRARNELRSSLVSVR